MPEAFPILTTARLILRLPNHADIAEMHAAMSETYDDVREWFIGIGPMPRVEDWAGIVNHAHKLAESGRDYSFKAFLKDDKTFVATLNLFVVDPAVPKWEIGYWCRAKFQGCGYVSEAAAAATQFAIDGLGANRVQILCDCNNLRSRRVAERSGFRLEAILVNDKRTPQGALRATAVYARLPNENSAKDAFARLGA